MRVRGRFVGCIQDAQDFGGADDFMISRINCEIGEGHVGYVTVKQIAGGSYAEDPLEVSSPQDYSGPPVDYQQLRDLAEHYYRSLFGGEGTAVRIGSGP
jgi:hypothetical protein